MAAPAATATPSRWRTRHRAVRPGEAPHPPAQAASHLLGQNAKYAFTPDQLEELGDKATTSRRNATAAVAKSYAAVSIPVRTRSGDTPYA